MTMGKPILDQWVHHYSGIARVVSIREGRRERGSSRTFWESFVPDMPHIRYHATLYLCYYSEFTSTSVFILFFFRTWKATTLNYTVLEFDSSQLNSRGLSRPALVLLYHFITSEVEDHDDAGLSW